MVLQQDLVISDAHDLPPYPNVLSQIVIKTKFERLSRVAADTRKMYVLLSVNYGGMASDAVDDGNPPEADKDRQSEGFQILKI